jgi:hypothetical protein
MNERIARLLTHRKNVERCQSLLKTKLNDLDVQFLSEERLAIAILQFMGPGAAKRDDHPDLGGQAGFEQLPLRTPGKPPQ